MHYVSLIVEFLRGRPRFVFWCAALTQAAEARGLTLSASVLPYLLSHFKRDMRSLATMLDALDQYSLETQRPVTLPLLRDLLLSHPPADAAQSETKQ